MTRTLRIFARLAAVQLTVAACYRGEFVIRQLTNVIIPLSSLLVWVAVLNSGVSLPVTGRYLVTYFIMIGVVSMLTSSWSSQYLADDIRLGELARWLTRPASRHLDQLANNVAEKVIKMATIAPLIAVLAWVFRAAFALPGSPLRWAAFTLSIALGVSIMYAMDVIVGGLAFWFGDTAGFDRARNLVAPVLNGTVVPLSLVPAWAAPAARLQPFRFTVSFPMEILLSGPAGGTLSGLALQAAWLAVFAAAACLLWRAGLRTYSAAGAS